MRRMLSAVLAMTLLAGCSDAPNEAPEVVPHGALVSSERLDDVVGASLYRVRYRSRSVAGEAVTVSGLVLVPPGDGPHPVLTWAHGTAGIADRCAPSRQPVPQFVRPFVEEGWVVVATDYEGLGTPGRHPYLAGISEGRSVLDIVRAASDLPGVRLSADTLIWGHSQGGHAALFAAQLAPTWTPELHIAGTVAAAPAVELPVVAEALRGGPYQGYLALAVAGLNAAYPEARLDDVLTDEALDRLGIVDTGCTAQVFDAYDDLPYERFAKAEPSAVPAWRRVLELNEPGDVRTPSPLLIVHGEADEQIPALASARLFDRLCSIGQVVERRTYPGADHVGVLVPSFPEVLRWMDDRLAGRPAPTGCP